MHLCEDLRIRHGQEPQRRIQALGTVRAPHLCACATPASLPVQQPASLQPVRRWRDFKFSSFPTRKAQSLPSASRGTRLCGSAIVCLRPHCSIGTEVGRIFARHIQMDNLNKSFRPDGVRAESLRSLPVKEVGRRTKRFGGLRGGISSFGLTMASSTPHSARARSRPGSVRPPSST
jgi:hypothetical protein